MGNWQIAMHQYQNAAKLSGDEGLRSIALANLALAAFEVGDAQGAIRGARQVLRRSALLACNKSNGGSRYLPNAVRTDDAEMPNSWTCELRLWHFYMLLETPPVPRVSGRACKELQVWRRHTTHFGLEPFEAYRALRTAL